jgi:hypothetical protein
MSRPRLCRLATLASQTLNVLLFDGNPDESVSARAYRKGVVEGDPVWARARRWIDRVFWWEPDHCHKAHQHDLDAARALLGLQFAPQTEI